MLVLSRKNGQKIIINDNIEITILDSRFDSCKIAIKAPCDVKIYREEVYQQIKSVNKMSNKTTVDEFESLNALINPSNEVKTNKVIIKKKTL